jgi:hypothetical protein
MVTYTWIGGSANFTTPHFWQIDGAPTSSTPAAVDDALIGVAGTYVVSIGSVEIQSLSLSDSAAAVDVQSALTVNGSLVTAGTIAVGQPGTASRLQANILSNSGTISIAAGSESALATTTS